MSYRPGSITLGWRLPGYFAVIATKPSGASPYCTVLDLGHAFVPLWRWAVGVQRSFPEVPPQDHRFACLGLLTPAATIEGYQDL